MDFDSVSEFLQDRTILVTGSTGFLAKVLVEKILRTQPNVRKVYLLLRATDAKTAQERLHREIINTKLFKVLRESLESNFDQFIAKKLVAVAGDISFEHLGITESNLREEMWKEVEVVVNVAATVNFDERYDVALRVNTFGALHALNFAKKCERLMIYLHTSTAYVCGEKGGVLLEKPFRMGETLNGKCKLDISEENQIMEQKLKDLRMHGNTEDEITSALKDYGIKRAKLHGWPNAYVFTKAMGEMLLMEFQGEVPMVIIRPTMITSTYKEPFFGWIEGLRTIDSVIAGYGKGRLTCFIGHPDQVLDVIPVDMVANAMVVVMATRANYKSCDNSNNNNTNTNNNNDNNNIIYHVSSSLRNPAKLASLHDFCYRFFVTNPLMNKKGEAIKVVKGTVLTTMNKFLLYMAIRYYLPLKGLQVVNLICFRHYDKLYKALDRRINLAMRLAKLYEPYVFFKGIFDDANLGKLEEEAQQKLKDSSKFPFDPKCIDWENYMMNIHIPGLIQHVLQRMT